MSQLRPISVDHLAIRVHDPDAARAFYVNVIGCKFAEALPQFHQEVLHAGATPISLVCRPVTAPLSGSPEPQAGGLDHFCLSLEDHASELREKLSMHGVVVEDEVINQGDSHPTLSLYVRDPSRNLIELRARL